MAARYWMAPEHGRTVIPCTPAQRGRALSLVGGMGLLEAVRPEAGAVFGETVLVAGLWTANEGRLRLVRRLREEHGCRLGPVTLWCGQRLREERDGSLEDILGRLAAADPRLPHHPWVRAELARDPQDGNRWERPFATEYELAIAAALTVFGPDLALTARHPATGPATVAGVPRRTVLWQQLVTADGPELTVLNAAARHRPQGPPRHTTAGCAEEWLAHLPPAAGARVLVVSGNPHTERTLGDIARVTRAAGRDDLSLHPAGNGAPERPWRLELCLGEVARLLHNDAVHTGAVPVVSAAARRA
ncbi:hypothetical protein Q3V23_34150 [Streptomyces sp. VNUA116]|uniref:hypothetical protein n=1 Tax=Streptomyces sp. VNUA116 TaxID=3062449 RepID=UPI002674672A|nr:hypothetical protein [Streptomyces sp. VNUA116]WKU48709.1 hypothetical protein Q3V23_34150 [Streptomyces sp. VNUA116]